MLKFKIVYYKMSKTKYGIIPLEKQTLDSINVCIMENIDKLKEVNIENNDKIKKLEKELTKYESIENEEKNEHDFEKIYELKREIQELKNVIDSNNELEYDYFFDTGDNLFRYYTNNEKDIEEDVNSNMTKIVKRYKRSQKKTILNDYTSSINSIVDINTLKINEDSCSNCKTELQLLSNESKMICPNCGLQSNILIDTDKATYNDPPLENTYFAYKRLNHLNECLVQFQAKENTIIPQEVCDIIKYELVKERKTDLSKLTPSMVRGYLKKHSDKGFNKYYEHIPHIINILNGTKAPLLTREYEEQLRMMFKEIQKPFMKHCPEGRKNFLSYSYVLHKFCELIELDDLLIFFPLLKSREKLQQQDKIWKNICSELQWEYIPSI